MNKMNKTNLASSSIVTIGLFIITIFIFPVSPFCQCGSGEEVLAAWNMNAPFDDPYIISPSIVSANLACGTVGCYTVDISGNIRLRANAWTNSTSAVNDKYIQWSLVPNSGTQIHISSVSMDLHRNPTDITNPSITFPESFQLGKGPSGYLFPIEIKTITTEEPIFVTYNTDINISPDDSPSIRLYAFNGLRTVQFDNMVICGSVSTILPVELLFFTAKEDYSNNIVILTWKTAQEIDNEGFFVQRSNNGLNWDNLEFITGKENSKQGADYQFLDKNPVGGINYYRLKQIDFDGQYEYSKINSVYWKDDSFPLKVYPNPFHNSLTIEPKDTGVPYQYAIFNQLGAKFYESEDYRNIVSRLNSLDSGSYLLRVSSSFNAYSQIVIKY